jgi:hypothetical protein
MELAKNAQQEDMAAHTASIFHFVVGFAVPDFIALVDLSHQRNVRVLPVNTVP